MSMCQSRMNIVSYTKSSDNLQSLAVTSGKVSSSSTPCPYCRELIRVGAIKCRHCKSLLTDVIQSQTVVPNTEICASCPKRGTLLLPIPAFVLGLMTFMMFLDDSGWDVDTIVGGILIASLGAILGGLSIAKQKLGYKWAVAGLSLSIVDVFILIAIAASLD